MTTREILESVKAVKDVPARLSTEEKNRLICAMADAVEADTARILEENRKDVEAAAGTISDVMIDRLTLTEKRIADMAAGMREVAALPDPVGEILSEVKRPNGLLIRKTAVPLGVVAIIYESRPNVTSDAAVLALKSGNACILRSGKEAFRSSCAVVRAMQTGIAAEGLPETIISLIQDTSRASATELMKARGFVDLLIPRGGAGLISTCLREAEVPCIQTGTGICHIYVDRDADLSMALSIVNNAKTSRPSVCNAEEVLLVHSAVATEFLPKLSALLRDEREAAGLVPVELILDPRAAQIIPGTPADETSFDTEFLDYKLAVGIVDSAGEAIDHINRHSTWHSEAIITNNEETAARFTRFVDSSAVYVNASTRFTDGGVFGLGCEMGISTQKLHARGPMGLRELTSYKYVILGSGQIR